MKIFWVVAFALAFAVGGCAAKDSKTPDAPRVVGADRDAHGCIGSAGYSWCARTKKCERPWELAKQAGFDNTPDGFKQYCAQ